MAVICLEYGEKDAKTGDRRQELRPEDEDPVSTMARLTHRPTRKATTVQPAETFSCLVELASLERRCKGIAARRCKRPRNDAFHVKTSDSS